MDNMNDYNNEFVIVTDSTSDLPKGWAEEHNVTVIPMTLIIEGKVYRDYPDERELSDREFYDIMRRKVLPTTSAINQAEFEEVMDPILNSGRDILFVAVSGSTSCTFSVAGMVGKRLMEKYPGRKVLTVDSLCASIGEGVLVRWCQNWKEQGMTIEQVKEMADREKYHICHFFTVDDLIHVMRSGRATKTTAVMGTLLGIKPVLRLNDEGLMETVEKARGQKCAFKKITERIEETIADRSEELIVGHSDCPDTAEELADMIRRKVGVEKITILPIGKICGNQTGAGTLSVFFRGIHR